MADGGLTEGKAPERGAKRKVLGPVLRTKSLPSGLAGANHFGTPEALSDWPRRR